MSGQQRKMPTKMAIHKYWLHEAPDMAARFGQCDVGEPSCYRCGWWPDQADTLTGRNGARPSEWIGFERAHLVDRCKGGPDSPFNLVLLCGVCHRQMPAFGPSDYAGAVRWVCSPQYRWADALMLIARATDALILLGRGSLNDLEAASA